MFRVQFLVFTVLLLASCQSREADPPASEEIQALPMNPVPFEDLSPFQTPGENWQIVRGAHSDYQTDHSMEIREGSGVLASLPTGSGDTNLSTELEHGDIELKVEFLVPKGSNSGLYLQGRYELQIFDSWGKELPGFFDVGGIYERWDASRPEGERGYEGHAPSVNAGLAPGLWQDFHIRFRAPRFDQEGNKIRNARFDFVRLNGQLIHEQVELSGPTRGAVSEVEVSHAPLMIQGDHGPVAFRNLRYKRYEQTDSLRLSPMQYTVYDFEGVRLPDFETLTEVLAVGVTDSFHVAQISPKNEYYAAWFTGELDVPVSGDYLFQTQISNAGNLYINGELVIPNDGEIDFNLLGAIINLEAGRHQLDMSYFQRTWGRELRLIYEGPQMERRALASNSPPVRFSVNNPLIVEPDGEEPVRIGGFTDYGDEKRTHTLSVGTPERMHYSYDLYNGTLLKFWRGPFADVTQMWRARGEEQRLVPLNASVENRAGFSLARISGNSIELFDRVPDSVSGQEYLLNEEGLPLFRNRIEGVTIDDEIVPHDSGESLVRHLRFVSDEPRSDLVAVLAAGSEIERLSSGLYRVNGNYYIRLSEGSDGDLMIREAGGESILIHPLFQDSSQSEVRYELIW